MAEPIISIVDLLHANGSNNPSGLATLHGYANLEDIKTVKTPKNPGDVGASLENIATITEAHVFNVGKCMSKLYGTENKGKGGYAPVGEKDSMGYKASAELSHPGSKPVADGLAKVFSSWNGLVFIKEADSIVRQYGSPEFPASVKVTYDTGNNEGYRGYKLEITAYGQAVIYTPGLNFTPAAVV
ncbi:hypothetical protein KHS38_12080 [Mucilaginibacter sp. Bleaf8]|uniref:hypothetical protein n=1 Tax=Mucilaginibacter sp. Bleaf8 TaxID=2834430 RepID=UPI001BD0EC4F|nr:hypothetical protein [Mucilaginibacter sp. Bleaf8]MBS7565143.1 hypothetical protein [Mucilaginibacter sp. Bleaf8]